MDEFTYGRALTPAGGPPAAIVAPDPPAPRGAGFWGRMSMMDWLLKHRDYLLDQIEQGHEVEVILADLALVSIFPTAFYGLVTGVATNSWVRMLSNPVKVPLVLVATLGLCLPALYVFSSYLGSRRTLLQTTALGFTATAIIAVILAAFIPITWFLTFTAPNSHALHVVVNVIVFAIAGLLGVQFLFQGARRLFRNTAQLSSQMTFLWCWIVLYGLVGLQMGYLFRPFFGASDVWITGRAPGQESVFVGLGAYIQQLFH